MKMIKDGSQGDLKIFSEIFDSQDLKKTLQLQYICYIHERSVKMTEILQRIRDELIKDGGRSSV
jgi:hypothetical protein